MRSDVFEPVWSSPPSDAVLETLSARNISVEELADALGQAPESIAAGVLTVDRRAAEVLSDMLGGTQAFWLERERQYRDDLLRQALFASADENSWLASLPLSELRKLGWLNASSSARESLLAFFGVSSVAEWRTRYRDLASAVSFRTSPIFAANLGSVLSWLRQGEIESERRSLGPWNRQALINLIPQMRLLARTRPASSFFPELRDLCASAGVALCMVSAPKGCRASGATWFRADGRPICLLSFRYGTDDQFWFTFFHEIGHLVLHSDRGFFLEDGQTEISDEEDEANKFSEDVLISQQDRASLAELPTTHIEVAKYARSIRLSPGIVVGQMQHMGILPNGWLQRLKKKYDWSFLTSE